MEMEMETKKYEIVAEFLDGKIETFEFGEFNEGFRKQIELTENENVVSITYRKTITYNRRANPFDKNNILKTLRRDFRDHCEGENCSLCRYRDVDCCELAFIIDHYETKDGDTNED